MEKEKEILNASIRIITPTFDLGGEVKDYESLQFTRRFYTVGEFELHINIHKANTGQLVKNNLIMLGKNVNKVGIIQHRESEIDENGEATDTLIIKGSTLQGVCAQRVIVPETSDTTGYDACSGTQETIMKHFVNAHVVNPTDAKRKIAQVSIAADLQRGAQDKWRFRFDNLADALAQIGQLAKLGWGVKIDFANNRWVFDTLQGRNLSASQDTLPPVIFMDEWSNIKNPHLIQSWLNAATAGYAGGQGDGANRLIQQVGDTTGLDRIEQFFDCSEAEDAAELLSMANQKLNEAAPTQTFEFSIPNPNEPYVYGVDYDLGDTVTAISKKWGVSMDTQITEVKEIYEAGGTSIEPVFGTATPNFLSYINRKTKRAVN